MRKTTGVSAPPGQRADALAHREAVDAGHAHVEQDAVDELSFEGRDGLVAARREDDAIPLVLEGVAREGAVRLVVVDDENRRPRELRMGGHGPDTLLGLWRVCRYGAAPALHFSGIDP